MHTLAQNIVAFGHWIKEVTAAVGKAIDAQDDERVILLQNEDGTTDSALIEQETSSLYYCCNESIGSILLGGKRFFVDKADPRIRSVHRRSG